MMTNIYFECVESETTKTSVLEKQRTITPTSFVSVIPLQKHIRQIKLLLERLNHFIRQENLHTLMVT